MDVLSIIGVLVSISALLLGNLLEGGAIGSLLNGPALIIVFGGTLGGNAFTISADDIYQKHGNVFVDF
jgi:flagellar motor component MotA